MVNLNSEENIMNTQTDREINKTLDSYSLITFETGLDEDMGIELGDNGTFEPISNNIESIRAEAERLISESLQEMSESFGDGFDWTIKYGIYGLPVDAPTNKETFKNRNNWKEITHGNVRLTLK